MVKRSEILKIATDTIGMLYDKIETQLDYIGTEYKITGQEIITEYNAETKRFEAVMDEEGKPQKKNKWESVKKENLSEDEEAQCVMIKIMEKYMENNQEKILSELIKEYYSQSENKH